MTPARRMVADVVMTISEETASADEPLSFAAELPRSPLSPYLARCLTRAALRLWRVRPETLETAELLISELVTNAVKGSRPDPPGNEDGSVVLSLRYHRAELTAGVSDSDRGLPTVRAPGTQAEHGRGMLLIQALSKEWGYYLLPPDGKVVYFVLAADRAPDACGAALAALSSGA